MLVRYKPNNVLFDKICKAVLRSTRRNQKEKTVMEYRLGVGLDRGRTLQETGDLLGITKERVRQIEDNCLARICLMGFVKGTINGVAIDDMGEDAILKLYKEWYDEDDNEHPAVEPEA